MPHTLSREVYVKGLAVLSLLAISLTVYVAGRRYSHAGASGWFGVTEVARRMQDGRAGVDVALQTSSEPSTATQAGVSEAYGNLPMSFEINQGQFDHRVKYSARGRGYRLFLTSDEAVLNLSGTNATGAAGKMTPGGSGESERQHAELKKAVLRMKLVGARRTPQIEGLDALPGKSHYFIGDDPAKWQTNVSHYTRVQYRDVYPGVNLVYYGRQSELEYDFIVAPGADVHAIKLAYSGAQDVNVHADGDLILTTAGGELRQHKPVIYQEVNGQKKEIAGRYTINRKREIGFEVAAYDAARPLVIDPVLSYASYLGGSGRDEGRGIAVDSSGNAYITGLTESSDFPTVNSRPPGNDSRDVFVTKINAAGTALVYSTYLGGRHADMGFGIAVDSLGSAYVTGLTGSPDFPTESPISGRAGGTDSDAFVTKLSPEGSALIYSTFLGGSNPDVGYGIAVDAGGSAYVTGQTDSANFPTANAAQPIFGGYHFGGDAFVTKLNPAGTTFLYSTFLGGSDYEEGRSIAVDSSGSAYVTGATHSTDFPTANAFQPNISGVCAGRDSPIAPCFEAFVTKLNAAGTALVYSTCLGGGQSDEGHGIAVDSAGNAYVAGETKSNNFPVTADAFQPSINERNSGPYIPDGDAFVTKFNAAGTALVYSTYLGGSRVSERVGGIAVASDGSAYVTGETFADNFPIADALQPQHAGGTDAFLTKFNAAGTALVYSTHFGGINQERATAIALDSAGNAYLTGMTYAGFPVEKPFQPVFGGGTVSDAFVAKIGNAPIRQPTVLSLSIITPGRGGNNGSVTVTLYGSAFKNGATVKLIRPGQPDITAVSVAVNEDSTIARARFDLTGHSPGMRDVILTNPDGRSVTRAAAFNVEVGGQPQVWVDLIGRDVLRPGRAQTYYIAYGNRGNVDAALVPIYIAMPKGTQYELGFNLVTPPQPVPGRTFDFSQVQPHYETDKERVLPLFIGFLPAGRSGFLKIRITGGDQPIRLIARRPQRALRSALVIASQRGSNSAETHALSDFDPNVRECLTTIVTDGLIGCATNFIPGKNLADCAGKAKELMVDHMVTAAATAADINNGTFDGQDAILTATQYAAGQVVFIGECVTKELSGPIGDIIDCGFAAHNIIDDCDLFDGVVELVKEITPFFAVDPNDKFGSAGVSQSRYLSGEEPLRYSINFENLESAAAPAQDVVVTDQLDGSQLDFDTFSLGPISLGKDKQIIPPPGLSEFRKDVDLRPERDLIVRVEAKLDRASGLLTWRFTSLDPVSGMPTEDPTAGFLPPNKNAPEGEGQVLFNVQAKRDVATGTEIRNAARIVFDTNAPIDTPEWLNTIDNSKPLSAVLPLPASSNSARFNVSWSGSDTGSGVRSYTIFVSEDGAPFVEWQTNTALTSGTFAGRPGHTYSFHSVARDAAGNEETLHATADATITTLPLVLQFGAAGYNVNEGAGGVQMSVTRTGNTTDAATIDYYTVDDPAAVRCDTVNGTAYARCDYATTVDTLHFAPGEEAKTLTVPVIDDAHVEGTETFVVGLRNPGVASLGTSTATVTILDNDTGMSVNPIFDSSFFIRQQYLDFLSREPDTDGYNAWLRVLNNCPDVYGDPACGRITVSGSFFKSTEFQLKGYYVYRFYKTTLGRRPDYDEIISDMRSVTGTTPPEVYEKRAAFAGRWVQRPEFKQAYDAMSHTDFVNTLMRNYGLLQITTPDPANPEGQARVILTMSEMIDRLSLGTLTRAQVVRALVDSNEVFNAEYNGAFVAMQYYGYLRRTPEAAGYDAWLKVINANSQDSRIMIDGFMNSVEYRLRFGTP